MKKATSERVAIFAAEIVKAYAFANATPPPNEILYAIAEEMASTIRINWRLIPTLFKRARMECRPIPTLKDIYETWKTMLNSANKNETEILLSDNKPDALIDRKAIKELESIGIKF